MAALGLSLVMGVAGQVSLGQAAFFAIGAYVSGVLTASHGWHFLPEIVDPATLEVLPPGVTGELVFTTLTKEALPLLRYRTRNLTSIDPEPCRCGRTLVRIGRITGRTDDMLIVRGVNVYPSQIEHALLQVEALAPHYLLVLRRERALDTLEVRVEGVAEVFGAGGEAIDALAARARRRIHEAIGITAEVTVVPPRTIERSAGKARRVEDLRGDGGAHV